MLRCVAVMGSSHHPGLEGHVPGAGASGRWRGLRSTRDARCPPAPGVPLRSPVLFWRILHLSLCTLFLSTTLKLFAKCWEEVGGRGTEEAGWVGRVPAGVLVLGRPPPPPSLWLSFFWLAICFHLGEFAGSEPPASAQTPLSSKPPVHCASISRSAHVLGASLMRADTG